MQRPQVNFRCDEKMLNDIDKRAKELGMKRSEYLKYLVVKDLNK